ncbi:MAG: hypothetical protein JNL08_08825 [Planctomycetes bacterium]|nr:hypothetical protein [Planctomycetota bacterium]
MAPTGSTSRSRWVWIAAVVLLCAFMVGALVLASWLCDDAYITFRSVENLIAGYGPRWNVDERVQTYTHPAWFWLLAAARWCTGECPLTAMWLGIGLTTFGAVRLACLAGGAPAAVALLVAALGSRTWLIYGTSGLETSLVFALLVALGAAVQRAEPERRLAAVAFVTALLACTRYDLVLLAGPVLLWCLRAVPWRAAVVRTAVAMLPLGAWLAFAAVYYGTIYPVTAYAKLFCHGVPALDVAAQGLRYLWLTVLDDPWSVALVAAAAFVGLRRPGPLRWFAVGTLLYCGYVVKVGGDYMLGRFWAPPIGAALVLLAAARPFASPQRALLFAGLAFAASFVPRLPLWTQWPAAEALPYTEKVAGVSDEHRFGQSDNGLLSSRRLPDLPGRGADMVRAKGLDRFVAMGGPVGGMGYMVGPMVYVADSWLCDPFLMRLPVADPEVWRIGHFFRGVPRGWFETLASGGNRIVDPGCARLYDAVWSATRDPLWSAERWGHLWDLWTGAFDADVAAFVAGEYRRPPRSDVPLAELAAPVPEPTWWFQRPTARSVHPGGLAVVLPAPTSAAAVELWLTADQVYRVRFCRDGQVLGEVDAQLPSFDYAGPFAVHRVAVPAAAQPFDRIWLDGRCDPRLLQPGMLARAVLVP